ncbi:MAG: hypothetical protein ACXVH1_37795 [Solirubrobacteraceae bacterium]
MNPNRTDAASARRRVAEQIERDAGLDAIEEFIDKLTLPREDKDSLWLLAWSELRMTPRRRPTVIPASALARHP